MRLPFCLLLLSLSLNASAQIFSYIDENGNRVFTNNPPPGSGASPVTLQPTNTIETPAEQVPESSPAGETPATPPYTQLQITGLPSDEAMRSNNGTFTVQVAMQPPLRSGHSLQLLLNGEAYGTPTNVPLLQLVEISRGDHSIAVQVLAGDQVIQQSAPLSFTVQRVHTSSPAQRPRPTPRAGN
jgi:hypothetical protein